MSFPYPPTRTVEATETLAGISFADPYRWLEQESEEVRQWQRAQGQLASAHVRDWPQFDRLRRLVARCSTDRPERTGALPRYAAGRWFRTRILEGATQSQAVVSDQPVGEGRVLFDPLTEDPQNPPFLSWIAPSPDGRILALGVCSDGSENNTIRLIDVATGELLKDSPWQTLMDIYTGGVHWLPDSSGFFFSALVGGPTEAEQRVYLHRRGPPSTTIPMEIGWTEGQSYRMAVVSRDGRYAVALERIHNPIPVAVTRLGAYPLRWRPFITSTDHSVAGHVVDDRYIAVTDLGAPKGRLVAVPLDSVDPNDPLTWQELVTESEAVLRTVTPVGEALYLTEFVDTYARVRVVDSDGNERGEVPLPDRGAVGEMPYPLSTLVPKGHATKFIFSFSSLTVSPGIYSHTPGDTSIETLHAPEVRLENAIVEDRWAVSADGTRVPYHLVRRIDAKTGAPQPTLIWAYGGYNVPLVPQFPGPMASFVEAGGMFVHAHLRGGGEFGLDWWQAGRLRKKQNGYDDLYAVAEDLIAAKLCAPQLLAVTGGSNGGLMAGVALTQRPDLWCVVVPRIPKLDLIGHCRNPYGLQSTKEENADVDDPEEVRRLASFSPYHLIRDGIDYPAVFIDAGDTDPRCPAWHARKFAARLQAAMGTRKPTVLHVWENVGHGWATDRDIAITEHTEWLAFALKHLGVNDW